MRQGPVASGSLVPIQPFAWLAGGYLLIALTLGGSSADPVFADIVRLLAAPLAAAAVWRMLHKPVAQGASGPVVILLGALLLILLQLAPLPPSLWRELPGRQIAVDGYEAAGLMPPWLPVSLTPDITRAAALGLLPPAAVLLSTLTLNDRSRRFMAFVVLAAALLSIGLGMLQLVGGAQSAFRIYSHTDTAAAVGFFANRNHQGAFLASSIVLAGLAATGRPRPGGPPRFVWIAVACAITLVFIAGAAVTRSRAAVILLAPGLLGFAAVAIRGMRGDASVGKGWAAVAGVIAMTLTGAALLVVFNFAPLASRFDGQLGADLRFQLAPRIMQAAWRFAPTGAGVGSFDAVYPMFEEPQELTNASVNHAHNDYLEVWLEAGWGGLALIIAFLVWWGMATRRLLLEKHAQAATGLAGAAVVLVLVIHSGVDYPLRTSAMASLFAFATGLMTRPDLSKRGDAGVSRSRAAGRGYR